MCTFHQMFKKKLKSKTSSSSSYFCTGKSHGHTVYFFWINALRYLHILGQYSYQN